MGADPSKPGTSRDTQTVAVVLATTPAAGLPWSDGARSDGTLLERLTEQLLSLPVREVLIVVRSTDVQAGGWWEQVAASGPRRQICVSEGLAEDLRIVAKTARASTSPVAVLAADVVAHTEALSLLLQHPARPTGAIVADGDPAPLRPPVRTEWGRVVSAGTSFHEVEWANGTFRGVLQVGEAHLAGLADVAEDLADLAQRRHLGRVGDGEAPELLLTGLVRAGVKVHAVVPGPLHCARVGSRPAAERAVRELADVDEAQARLDAAVKSGDGFFATHCVSSWSRHLIRPAARLGLTPNTVTGISVAFAAIAAVWFSDGHRAGLVVGAVALYLSFVFDCLDGQLARYTRRFSPLGSWLDAICDRFKEYLVYVGLAAGYVAAPGATWQIWGLAVAAMLLQAIRHMVDFSYAGAVTDRARAADLRASAPRSMAVPWDEAPAAAAAKGTGSVLALSRRLDALSGARGVVYWAKKMIVLPIGERMALISVTAALFDARVTFLALLGWGVVALAYTTAGRMVRSFA
ncbi:hypothetical protein GCM10010116_36990 [Microbispora rosea subsp. aerata]|nr:hypothetical protein GCM10010116_36990 [Microbispora rosea subsp. aerata]GIH56665.1 hypothetical protein Mro02_35790 [Microbispora rosea subsp. aerata]GLJ82038.1 hypothetical protein GCM10017588_07630 [Microbispora rosea subsp. aerata]